LTDGAFCSAHWFSFHPSGIVAAARSRRLRRRNLGGSPITTNPRLTSVLAGLPGGLVLVACLGAVLLRRRARTALA
jgi:hypothetical protein